jgi:hypothetical protein
MRRFFILATLLTGIFVFSAAADEKKYKEIASFSELLANHQEGTVYFLDLDNTVLRPEGYFGSDPWFKELFKAAGDAGIPYDKWRELMNLVVAAISEQEKFVLVDPAFRDFYEKVGPKALIGLTARSKDFQRALTAKHFKDLGIAFRAEEFFPNYHAIDNLKDTLFAPETGVIIVGRLNKGDVLKDFIRRHGKGVKRVVFVDDLAEHAEAVAEKTADLDIPVESYRLTAADDYLEGYESSHKGRWSVEGFFRDYVFGSKKHLYEDFLARLLPTLDADKAKSIAEAVPHQPALLKSFRDPPIFDTSVRFTEFSKGWNYRYTPTRVEMVHNPIVEKKMMQGTVSANPMLIFTSGSMGVGKGFSIGSLMSSGIIDPSKYLVIDPDEIKTMMPEYADFLKANPRGGAGFVHRESGHIQERLTELAMRTGKNIIVDGSLGAYDWWKKEIPRIQKAFPHYTTAILTVSTDAETQEERIRDRARIEGRDIEDEVWRANRKAVEDSVEKLKHIVDFQLVIDNAQRPKVTEVFYNGQSRRVSYRPNLNSGDVFSSNALFSSSGGKLGFRSPESILSRRDPLVLSNAPDADSAEILLKHLRREHDQLVVSDWIAAHPDFLAAAQQKKIDLVFVGDPKSVDTAKFSYVVDMPLTTAIRDYIGEGLTHSFNATNAQEAEEFLRKRKEVQDVCITDPKCLSDYRKLLGDRSIVSITFDDSVSKLPALDLNPIGDRLGIALANIDPDSVRLIVDVRNPAVDNMLNRVLKNRGFDVVAITHGVRPHHDYASHYINAGRLKSSRAGFYERFLGQMRGEGEGRFNHFEVNAANADRLVQDLTRDIYLHHQDEMFRSEIALARTEQATLSGHKNVIKGRLDLDTNSLVIFDGNRSSSYPDRASLKAHLLQSLESLPAGTKILLQSSAKGLAQELALIKSLIAQNFPDRGFQLGVYASPGHPVPLRPSVDFVLPSHVFGNHDLLDFALGQSIPTTLFGLEPSLSKQLKKLLLNHLRLEVIDDSSLRVSDREVIQSLFSRNVPLSQTDIDDLRTRNSHLRLRSQVSPEFLGEAQSAAAAKRIATEIDSLSDADFLRSLLQGYRELTLLAGRNTEVAHSAAAATRIDLGPLALVNARKEIHLADDLGSDLTRKVSLSAFGVEVPELDRSVEMSLLIKLILQGRYEDFVRPQKPGAGDAVLSKKSFANLRRMIEAVADTPDNLDTMLTYLNLMRIGKSEELLSFLKREAGIVGYNHNLILPIALQRYPELFPSYARLPEAKQAVIRNIISSDFNMGQLIQGENTTVSLEPLKHLSSEELRLVLATNIFKVAGARGHSNILGTSVMTDNVFRAFDSAFVELSNLATGVSPHNVYENFLRRRGAELGIKGADREELTAIKLGMLFRSYNPEEGAEILRAVQNLPESHRNNLVNNMMNDGYDRLFSLPYYSPKLMEKTIEHIHKVEGKPIAEARLEGIRRGLPVIAKIYEKLDVVQGTGIRKVHAETLIPEIPRFLGAGLEDFVVEFDRDASSGELLSRAVFAGSARSAAATGETCDAPLSAIPTPAN